MIHLIVVMIQELTNLQTIATVTINVPILQVGQLPNLDAWLRSILWDSKLPIQEHTSSVESDDNGNLEVHRLKARLPLSNGEVKLVQGVRDVFEILDSPESLTLEVAPQIMGKIVLIGRRLIQIPFEESLLNAIKSQQPSCKDFPSSDNILLQLGFPFQIDTRSYLKRYNYLTLKIDSNLSLVFSGSLFTMNTCDPVAKLSQTT